MSDAKDTLITLAQADLLTSERLAKLSGYDVRQLREWANTFESSPTLGDVHMLGQNKDKEVRVMAAEALAFVIDASCFPFC